MILEREQIDPPLPDHVTLGGWALFLDLDGTLLDLAPKPDSVVVSQDLIETLAVLQTKLEGALAILSGRSLSVIDRLLHPLQLAAAGEHGISLRGSDGGAVLESEAAMVPTAWRTRIHELALAWPGALVEEKSHSIAVHFRANPALETEIAAELGRLVANNAGFEVLTAIMAREIRHCTANKGSALRHMIQWPAFASRRPLFIGDDVTDEDAIVASRALGGLGLRVADHFNGQPANVRAWLKQLAGRS